MSTAPARLGRGLKSLGAYLKAVLGEDAYEQYLAHHRRTACEAPAMTAKEFWRDKTDRQDANPQGRCC
ncbi:putative selenoprotein [Paenarthrobacter sp. DKR-5]|uniref:YbdD/YjiX family protein n=1 Tax=Paenarthrobacter sp. DKR-5 TaxID=2835535 RepID=UPI001BDD3482|nr:YbdD/YjiX family protein [Paenarthrobacter sp. DKR-5]MBT1003596.1 putative selenoprotein [Paenarthrobacter sp. DKR-5]